MQGDRGGARARTTGALALGLAADGEPLPERPEREQTRAGPSRRAAARSPALSPSIRAVSVWAPSGRAPLRSRLRRERLAGDVVGVLAHGLEQAVVAEQRQLDPVLDLRARRPCGRSGPRARPRARRPSRQQLVVEVELQRDRVVGLALELVARRAAASRATGPPRRATPRWPSTVIVDALAAVEARPRPAPGRAPRSPSPPRGIREPKRGPSAR